MIASLRELCIYRQRHTRRHDEKHASYDRETAAPREHRHHHRRRHEETSKDRYRRVVMFVQNNI